MANEHDDENPNVNIEDELKNLNDLTVLQIHNQSLGEARMNTVRPSDASEGKLDSLATIHQGSSLSPNIIRDGAIQTGVSITAEQVIASNEIPPIDSIVLATTPLNISEATLSSEAQLATDGYVPAVNILPNDTIAPTDVATLPFASGDNIDLSGTQISFDFSASANTDFIEPVFVNTNQLPVQPIENVETPSEEPQVPPVTIDDGVLSDTVRVPVDLAYKTVTETYVVPETHTETYTTSETHSETYTAMEDRTITVPDYEIRTETTTEMVTRTETVTEMETRTEMYYTTEVRQETYVSQEPRTVTYTVLEPREETYTTTETRTVTVMKEWDYEDGGRNANNLNANSLEEALDAANGKNHDTGDLVFKNVNNSSFNLGSTNDLFVVQENSHNLNLNLGGGDNVVIFEKNPGQNVNLNAGTGKDILVLPGNASDYNLHNLHMDSGTHVINGQITGPDSMMMNVNGFETIKFADTAWGNFSILKETKTVEVEVEHTRTVEVPVEYTRTEMADVVHTRDVEVQVEHTREIQVPVEHTVEVQVPVEHTHEVQVQVGEHTETIQVPVEHTRDVTVEAEHTREVTVDVEHTRDVQVVDTDTMQANGAYQEDGRWVESKTVDTFGKNLADDNIITDNNDHIVNAGAGNDIIHTGTGNDIIVDGQGSDFVYGDAGNDLFVFRDDGRGNPSWTDHVDGGTGFDTVFMDVHEQAWTAIDDYGNILASNVDTQHGNVDLNDVHVTVNFDDGSKIGFDHVEKFDW